jgi:hypothetical protein
VSNFLSKRDIRCIRKWIKELKKFKYKPRTHGDTKAFKKLRLPYKLLSCGYNRIVYDLGKKVLKVAISIKGIRDNRNEARLYRRSPMHLRKHLGKVLAYGKGWIIMKNVKMHAPRTFKYKKSIIGVMGKFVKRRIMPNDVFILNRPKPEWRNLGINKKGEVVIVDYGNFKFTKIVKPTYSNLLLKKSIRLNSKRRFVRIKKNTAKR